jgi:hypothetical protein
MNLIEFIENKFDCKIDKEISDENVKEFLLFMKVECVTKYEMVEIIWGKNIPKDLVEYVDFDKVVNDYCYVKVNDDCYINENDLEYFKEKYETGVKYFDYTMSKFIKEYNDVMNDDNCQECDYDIFPF